MTLTTTCSALSNTVWSTRREGLYLLKYSLQICLGCKLPAFFDRILESEGEQARRELLGSLFSEIKLVGKLVRVSQLINFDLSLSLYTVILSAGRNIAITDLELLQRQLSQPNIIYYE